MPKCNVSFQQNAVNKSDMIENTMDISIVDDGTIVRLRGFLRLR